MGRDLYYTIIEFFERRMREHSMVLSFHDLNIAGEYVYEVHRRKFGDKIRIWLSDAYHFTEMDYHNRPKELKTGDYILIAKPEGGGGVDPNLIGTTKIGVGKLGELMGALNVKYMWTYEPPTEEERKAKKEAFTKKKRFKWWPI